MMSEEVILVSYGEITLKSSRVRSRMERVLIKNIISQLKRHRIDVLKIHKEGGRLFVWTSNNRDAIKILTKVFGVVSASIALKTGLDLNEIVNEVKKYSKEVLINAKTFAIRARRPNKGFPITSIELARILGDVILKEMPNLKVDLDSPDKEIFVEIRRSGAYIYHERELGPKGLPYGVEGKVIALMSGGIDSAVAAWMIMKRGCTIVPIHYDLGHYVSPIAKERIVRILKWLKEWIPSEKVKVHVVPLAYAHELLKGNINEKYRCIFCRAMMYLIAQEMAKEVGAKGIVTGENLGQVASQTLDNLYLLSRLIDIPILRPVIGFDKEEIAEIARRIGVYDIANIKVECKLVPRHPETHAKEEEVLKELEKVDIKDIVRSIIKQRQIVTI